MPAGFVSEGPSELKLQATKLSLEFKCFKILYVDFPHLNIHKQNQVNFYLKTRSSTPCSIFPTLLLPICLSLLACMIWLEFSGIYFEEVRRLLRVLAGDIMESTGGNVVGLALSDQRIVLKQILNLRRVR